MLNKKIRPVFLTILTTCLAWPATASAQSTINAGDMVFRSVGQTHEQTGWVLSDEGYLGTFIELADAGTVTITLSADGEMADGVFPVMDLHVANRKATWCVVDHGSPHTTYGTYSATFELPAGMHAVRVEYLNDYSTGDRNLYINNITFSGAAVTVVNQATETNVLACSNNYISNCRQGFAQVHLYDSAGNPATGGLPVQVALDRHRFLFGTTVYGLDMSHYSWVAPNPTPGTDPYYYQQYQSEHFDTIAIENAGKWKYNENTRDVVDMDYVDAIFDYAELHDLRVRLHSCLWDYDPQEPDWVNTLQVQALTDPAAAQEYRDEITERIQYYVTARAGRYADLDGINESYHNPVHTNIFGLGGVADIYNEIAAATDGKAKVFVNEYSVASTGSGDYSSWYRQHVQDIIDLGGQVDGVGVQSHMYLGYDDPVTVYRVFQNLAGLERTLRVTEFSLDNDETGNIPDILSDMMTVTFGCDQFEGFITWGFWRNAMWRKGAALLDADWNLTPAGVAYEQLRDQWNTALTANTDSGGSLDFTGYYGEYLLDLGTTTCPMLLTPSVEQYHVFAGDPGAPVAPGDLIAKSATTDSIDWIWQDNAGDETGYTIYAQPGQGPPMIQQTTEAADTESWNQSSLSANSAYAVQVAAVNANGLSGRSMNVVGHTLPAPPVQASAGAAAVDVDMVPNGVRFIAVNGFGDGQERAALYRYRWGQSSAVPADWKILPLWQNGDLVMELADTSNHYLHLQACNADGQGNPVITTLGPFNIADHFSADFDLDDDVDMEDFGHLQMCLSGTFVNQNRPECQDAKLTDDNWVDQADVAALVNCFSGAGIPADTECR